MTQRKEALKKKALTLPLLPGVYLMKDQEGSIIYVGKSKHLRKRVSSYFGNRGDRPRKVERMIRHIVDFDYQVTDTELDALLLECDLIKEIRPLYNKLLKNDSRYRYIHLNECGLFPFWESTYDRKEEGVYFGPYDMKYEIDRGIEAINSYYGLAQCKAKPNKECCIGFLTKQCLAPCHYGIQPQYKVHIEEAIKFFKDQDESILEDYEKKMQQASEALQFEKAQADKEVLSILRRITYREKAIEWSLSGKKSIAILPCPAGGYKVYLLVGASIRDTKLLKKKRILSKWRAFLKEERLEPTLRRAEVDRAYILYNYLHRNNDCEVIVIED